MKALSDRKVAIALSHKGFTVIEIVEEVNAHFLKVSRWIKQKREDPNNNVFDPLLKFKGNKSRLKCMDRHLDTMRRSVTASPGIKVTEMKTNNLSLQHLSVKRMQEILQKKLGFRVCRKAKKPLLTPRTIDDRIRFCNMYQHWTEQDWLRILFSDESTFRVRVKLGSYWVRRPRASDRFNPRFTFRRNRQEQGVTVWGCFSGHGRGNLVFLPHKAMMNTTRYITVLECEVVPTMAAHGCTEYLLVIVMKTILKSQLFFFMILLLGQGPM